MSVPLEPTCAAGRPRSSFCPASQTTALVTGPGQVPAFPLNWAPPRTTGTLGQPLDALCPTDSQGPQPPMPSTCMSNGKGPDHVPTLGAVGAVTAL